MGIKRTQTTHHDTVVELKNGVVSGGGTITETQDQDTALVKDLGGKARRFNFIVPEATAEDSVYVVADANNAAGRWFREDVSQVFASNINLVIPADMPDNAEDVIVVPLTGVTVGSMYGVALLNGVTDVVIRAEQVLTAGELRVHVRVNKSGGLTAQTFAMNVYELKV